MSVLIKLMKMPKQADTYHARIKVYKEGYPTISVTEDNITTTYDMIPVPTPHGRLIDADALLSEIRYGAEIRAFCNKCKIQDCQNCLIQSIDTVIRNSPTIIEAEVYGN